VVDRRRRLCNSRFPAARYHLTGAGLTPARNASASPDAPELKFRIQFPPAENQRTFSSSAAIRRLPWEISRVVVSSPSREGRPRSPSRRRSLHLTDSGPQHFLNFFPEPLRRLQSRAARGYGVPSFRRKPLTPSGPAFNSRSMSGYVTSSPAVRSPITRKMASFCVRFRK
jgi:hypothetical protein